MSEIPVPKPAGAAAMSEYERHVWAALQDYWERHDNRRGLPNWAENALERGGDLTRNAAKRMKEVTPEAVKKPIRKAGDAVATAAARPTIAAVTRLLELSNDWATDLQKPAAVEKLARSQGIELESFTDLRHRDLKSSDRLLIRNTLKWRSIGAAEGGVMGALALVPVAGIPVAITADILLGQVLSIAIATRVAYSYGYDAKDPPRAGFH